MIVYERPIRFEDVDAAGIVFFAKFFHYAHEALEALFDGAYADIVVNRRIGFPVVHVASDFHSPVRYGDTVRIETGVSKIGTTSVTFRHTFSNKKTGALVATVDHVAVTSRLDTLTKLPLPEDVRAILEKHLIHG